MFLKGWLFFSMFLNFYCISYFGNNSSGGLSMSVSVLELLDNPERAILSQKDSLPLLDIDHISARHIEKLIRVKAKVVEISDPRGVIKLVAYVCPNGHVTKVDNPLIHPPEKIIKCPECGAPVKVSLEHSIPTDVREITLAGESRKVKAFIVGAYATKDIEPEKEYIFTGTVKGQLDETTFQIEITHLELYHFEEVKGTVELKEGKDVDVQSKIIEGTKPAREPIKVPVEVVPTDEKITIPPEQPAPVQEEVQPVPSDMVVFEPKVEFIGGGESLFGALSKESRMRMTFMNNPKIVVEVIGVSKSSGQRLVDVFKDYWTVTWPEIEKITELKLSEIYFRVEVVGNVAYIDVHAKGKSTDPKVERTRNKLSLILEKHSFAIYSQTGVKFQWRGKDFDIKGPTISKTPAKPKDVGILAGLFGEESEESTRTAKISNKLKTEENIHVGDVTNVVSGLKGLRQGLSSELGEVVIEKIPKPSTRMITTQEISIMKEILYEVEDDVGSIYGIPIDAVIERAVESGISEEKANSILQEMKKAGIIFDGIKPGYIKLKR
jgi:hypothetical protein